MANDNEFINAKNGADIISHFRTLNGDQACSHLRTVQ